MASPEVKATLEEDFKLAEALGLNGTPSYVIGDDVVVGAVGLPGAAGKDQHRALRQGDLLTAARNSSIIAQILKSAAGSPGGRIALR